MALGGAGCSRCPIGIHKNGRNGLYSEGLAAAPAVLTPRPFPGVNMAVPLFQSLLEFRVWTLTLQSAVGREPPLETLSWSWQAGGTGALDTIGGNPPHTCESVCGLSSCARAVEREPVSIGGKGTSGDGVVLGRRRAPGSVCGRCAAPVTALGFHLPSWLGPPPTADASGSV